MGATGENFKSPEQGLKYRNHTVLRSFVYAWAGLVYVYKTQRNMPVHCFLASIAGAMCIILGVGRVEVLMVALAVAGVLSAEVVNTVTESFIDLVTPDYNKAAKIIKDVAAAGVLLMAAFSVIVGIAAFAPALACFPQRLDGLVESRLPLLVIYSLTVFLPAGIGVIISLRNGREGK